MLDSRRSAEKGPNSGGNHLDRHHWPVPGWQPRFGRRGVANYDGASHHNGPGHHYRTGDDHERTSDDRRHHSAVDRRDNHTDDGDYVSDLDHGAHDDYYDGVDYFDNQAPNRGRYRGDQGAGRDRDER